MYCFCNPDITRFRTRVQKRTYLVEFEHSKLDLLLLMLGLLGGGVVLLLALLGASAQPEHQVEGGLLLDVVVGQGAAILQLLAGEDQTLLVGRDACTRNQFQNQHI